MVVGSMWHNDREWRIDGLGNPQVGGRNLKMENRFWCFLKTRSFGYHYIVEKQYVTLSLMFLNWFLHHIPKGKGCGCSFSSIRDTKSANIVYDVLHVGLLISQSCHKITTKHIYIKHNGEYWRSKTAKNHSSLKTYRRKFFFISNRRFFKFWQACQQFLEQLNLDRLLNIKNKIEKILIWHFDI